MRPLVDVVANPVPPVLEELGGGAGVVDLVEVHAGGLAEAVDPRREDHQDQGHDDPHVEFVESASRFGRERG